MSAKQNLKQRKALRSAAAKKGWETRRLVMRERDAASTRQFVRVREEMERMQNAFRPAPDLGHLPEIPDVLRGVPPKPTLWQRIKGWFA